MTNLRKGSIISEYQYGVELVCEIISDITIIESGKFQNNPQEFQAKVLSVNGIAKKDGSVVEYLIGGAYGASIQVLQY